MSRAKIGRVGQHDRLEDQGGPTVQWFQVRAALLGSPTSVIESAVPDLQEELEARTYLRNPRITWDSNADRAIVEVEDEAPTPQGAGGSVYDEIFESACAVLGDFEFFRVEILNITADPHD